MTNANESAFPRQDESVKGLTKREYFAAMALTGLLVGHSNSFQSNIEMSVKAADKLIIELNKVV